MGNLLILNLFFSLQSNGTVARLNQHTKNLSFTPIRPPVTPALTPPRLSGTPVGNLVPHTFQGKLESRSSPVQESAPSSLIAQD
jgi:hypothetical protein